MPNTIDPNEVTALLQAGLQWPEVGRRLNLTPDQTFDLAVSRASDEAIRQYLRALTASGAGLTNGFEDRSESQLAWDDATRTLTLSPVSDSFVVWARGTRVLADGALTVTVPDTTGLYVVVMQPEGRLEAIQTDRLTDDIVLSQALVGVLYWNADQGTAPLVGDERHGLMDTRTHLHLHESFGTQLQRDYRDSTGTLKLWELTGINIQPTGDADSHAGIAMDGGAIRDEDLRLTSEETSQELGAPAESDPLDSDPLVPAVIPTLYRAGANGDWYIQTDKAFPMLDVTETLDIGDGAYAGARQPWNQDTGSGWTLTEAGQADYVLVHLFASNDIRHRVIAVQGQATYTSPGDARDGARREVKAVQLEGLPFPELVPLYTLLVQTSTGYTNAPAARFDDLVNNGQPVADWRFGLASN
jgi:hypothetical protein